MERSGLVESSKKDISCKAGHAVSLSMYLQHLVSSSFICPGFWNSVADILNYPEYNEGQ